MGRRLSCSRPTRHSRNSKGRFRESPIPIVQYRANDTSIAPC